MTVTVDAALLGLARTELPVFLLSVTVRANATHGRLVKALDALTVALVDRDRSDPGFAC